MGASGVLTTKMFLEIPPMHAIIFVRWSIVKENTADLKITIAAIFLEPNYDKLYN